jgi:DNA topoisomerase VI subunit B
MDTDTVCEPINVDNMIRQMGGLETGHTQISLLKELIDNGIDAKADKIKLTREYDDTNGDSIKYSDNGLGMNKHQLQKCVQIYSENNSSNIGKFGIGGVSAIVNFSDIYNPNSKAVVKIITKTKDGQVLSLNIDWNKSRISYDNYREAINNINSNDCSDIRQIRHLCHGTTISIFTSENKAREVSSTLDDWDD